MQQSVVEAGDYQSGSHLPFSHSLNDGNVMMVISDDSARATQAISIMTIKWLMR